MEQKELMRMITSPSSWEQVMYEVIAWEGLNPWDLDLTQLAEGFLGYMKGLEQMDFKIPAKFVMVASLLLRMKSDHLPLLDYFQEEPAEDLLETNGVEAPEGVGQLFGPLAIPPARLPVRRLVVSELVAALRKALGTADRRNLRTEETKKKITIRAEDLGKRISSLYERINAILALNRKEEVGFSKVVPEWSRPAVAETFLPLIYLEHQKRVECRQEVIFDEIYIRARGEREKVAPSHKKEESGGGGEGVGGQKKKQGGPHQQKNVLKGREKESDHPKKRRKSWTRKR